jgi:hypothetical protein
MKNPIPPKSQEAANRLLSVLRKMAEFYEYDAGRVLTVSPREIAEFINHKSNPQRIAAVAKAHPEIVSYRPSYRKTYQGCMASRAAAGYYEAQIKWTVSRQ